MAKVVEQPFARGLVGCCPICRHSQIAVRVLAWADFKEGVPFAFDPEDIDYVDPIADENAICRSCGSTFLINE
jgi:hypothetical protein